MLRDEIEVTTLIGRAAACLQDSSTYPVCTPRGWPPLALFATTWKAQRPAENNAKNGTSRPTRWGARAGETLQTRIPHSAFRISDADAAAGDENAPAEAGALVVSENRG
jgi:hypothetical protein